MSGSIKSSVAVAAIIGVLSLSSGALFAAEYPMEQKLQECNAAFKAAHKKDISREEAAKAKAEHVKLMVDILRNLNEQNTAAADQGKPLSPVQVSNNVRVMGHLLEMLAADHMPEGAEWSYLY